MERLSHGLSREIEKQTRRKAELSDALKAALQGIDEVCFEPGCGHGHWLTDYAELNPEEVCVGIDLLSLRVRKAIAKKEKRGLSQLHFFKADLNEFLECLPENILFARTVFLFPDPWPKARHHKRRMIQADTLTKIAARTKRGGALYFRTDDSPYFEWTIEHLSDHPAWTIEEGAPWLHERETYFQSLMEEYFSVVARKVES